MTRLCILLAVFLLANPTVFAAKEARKKPVTSNNTQIPELSGEEAKRLYEAMLGAGYGVDCSNGGCRAHGKIECGKTNPEIDNEAFYCTYQPDPDWQ